MLEGLQDKFVDERVTLEKEEAQKRHTYVPRRASLRGKAAPNPPADSPAGLTSPNAT